MFPSRKCGSHSGVCSLCQGWIRRLHTSFTRWVQEEVTRLEGMVTTGTFWYSDLQGQRLKLLLFTWLKRISCDLLPELIKDKQIILESGFAYLSSFPLSRKFWSFSFQKSLSLSSSYSILLPRWITVPYVSLLRASFPFHITALVTPSAPVRWHFRVR